jgi:copper chaperone CopZ
MLKKIIFIMVFALLSVSSQAKEFSYEADVDGMVCAFCVYNVSKNISTLPGVKADSVNVDLVDGHVVFHSKKKVSEKKLVALFKQSGFTISNLTEKESSADVTDSEEAIPDLDLSIDIYKSEQFTTLIEALGSIAASTPSRMIIEAPALFEEKLLKPILMGRQQVIKVRFVPAESEVIHIQLFAE